MERDSSSQATERKDAIALGKQVERGKERRKTELKKLSQSNESAPEEVRSNWREYSSIKIHLQTLFSFVNDRCRLQSFTFRF